MLRQETLKSERLVYQIRAFESSSDTWIQEKLQLNDALRAKLEENNSLQLFIKQEQVKFEAVSYDLEQMTAKYQAYADIHANTPASPLVTSAMMVADIAPEMQLTIMETTNSMSHELLIEFSNENVCPPSTPEVAPTETLPTTSALKRPPDKIRKSKPMTAMALILQTVTLLSGLKPVDASKGDIFEVENVVSPDGWPLAGYMLPPPQAFRCCRRLHN